MLYCYGIGISGDIDVNKASTSKECIICLYWYFLGKVFKFQHDVCNGADVLMMSVLNIHSVDYHCFINTISKSEAKRKILKKICLE